MPILYGCTVMVFSGPYRVLQEGRKSCLPNLGDSLPITRGNLERGGLSVPTLLGGAGLGARPEGVPQVGEPQEKTNCASPPAALAYVNRLGGDGAVFPGGLQLGSPMTVCCHTRTTTTTSTTHPGHCDNKEKDSPRDWMVMTQTMASPGAGRGAVRN
jgi:hypothetical protein